MEYRLNVNLPLVLLVFEIAFLIHVEITLCLHFPRKNSVDSGPFDKVGTSLDNGGDPPFPPPWEVLDALTDDFNGDKLNSSKWIPDNPGWKGRQPGLFYPPNVQVSNGTMQLTAKFENVSGEPEGFMNFTTAAVQSIVPQRYGYFEVRVKAMNSRASSSFWFSAEGTPDKDERTEIDVFELCGGASCIPLLKKRFNMNLHSFRHPNPQCNGTKKTLNNHSDVIMSYLFSSDFHVMGLLWEEDYIVWTLDGKVVRNTTNLCFDQALKMNFDSETMPNWMTLPDPKNLPSTYYVDYVKSWQRPKSFFTNNENKGRTHPKWKQPRRSDVEHSEFIPEWEKPDIFGDFIKGSLGIPEHHHKTVHHIL